MKKIFFYACILIIILMNWLATALEAATSWINEDNALSEELKNQKYPW